MSSTWFPGITPSRPAPVELDTGVAHPARIYDCIPFQYRTKQEFGRFLTGLELVPPGIVPMAEWRAGEERQPRPAPVEAAAYAAVARKN